MSEEVNPNLYANADMKSLLIRHFHIPEYSWLPAATVVAMKRPESAQPDVAGMEIWDFSWSVCSPFDQFSRKMGVSVALDKMDERGIEIFKTPEMDGVLDEGINIILNSTAFAYDKEVMRLRTTLSIVMEVFRQEDMENRSLVGRMFNKITSFLLRYPMK